MRIWGILSKGILNDDVDVFVKWVAGMEEMRRWFCRGWWDLEGLTRWWDEEKGKRKRYKVELAGCEGSEARRWRGVGVERREGSERPRGRIEDIVSGFEMFRLTRCYPKVV